MSDRIVLLSPLRPRAGSLIDTHFTAFEGRGDLSDTARAIARTRGGMNEGRPR